MTTALDRRMERAAKAQGRGGRNGPKVGVIAPTLPPETKPRKRETKDPDDETLDAALETKGVLPKASGDGSEDNRITTGPVPTRVKLTTDVDVDAGLWRGLEIDVVEYFPPTERAAVLPPDGGAAQILPVTAFVPIHFAEAGSPMAKQRLVPLYGGTLFPASDAYDDAKDVTKPSKSKRDRRAARRQTAADVGQAGPFPPGFPAGIRLTREIEIDRGHRLAKGNNYVVYRQNDDESVDVMSDGTNLTARIPKDAYELTAPKAAGPQVQPAAPGTAAATKGKPRGKGKLVEGPTDKPPPRKSTAEAAAELDVMASIAGLEVVRLPLASLVRHPQNRRPLPADVAARADSLEADGQLEPIVVRADGESLDDNGRFQILSGETRYLAAKKLGWPDLAARVVPDCDDRRALRLLALFNAQRKDLNPIEKARALEDLAAAGYTRDQAARLVGLETGAAATNLVRLLELPEVWQARVASGELPQSWARPLTTIARAPTLLKEADECWRGAHGKRADTWDAEYWQSRENIEEYVDQLLDQIRPIDKSMKGGRGGDQTIAFELTDDVRKQLQIETVVLNGKPTEVAVNFTKWDELQEQALAVRSAKRNKKKAGRSADDDEAEAKPAGKTAAEVRAAKKKADEQLAARIDGWRSQWLKSLIAPQLVAGQAGAARMAAAIMMGGFSGYKGHHPLFAECLSRVLDELHVGAKCSGLDCAWHALGKAAVKVTAKTNQPRYDWIVCEALKLFLAEEDKDPRQPLIQFEFIDAVADELSIDLAEAWKDAQKTDGKPWLETFLLLHTGGQLDDLAAEWKVDVEGQAKAGKVELLHNVPRLVPLPKSIKPLGATGKRKRGR